VLSTLYDSRRVRLLTIIDEGNREGPSASSTSSSRCAVGHQPCVSTTVPNSPRSPSSTGAPSTAWRRHYIQPGKPDQNAYIVRFNRSYRTEVLNAHLFESIAELRAMTNAWLRVYNGETRIGMTAMLRAERL
jgi:putative transposase